MDRARPDVGAAAAPGTKYVHIPIGYDGVPSERQREIAKTARELPGPFFVHCHHGKHRGTARSFRSPAEAETVALEFDFPEVAPVPELAAASRDLEGALRAEPPDPDAAEAAFRRLSRSCSECRTSSRNAPVR